MKRTLEEINAAALNPSDFIAECTREYKEEIKKTAAQIAADDRIKVVGIAGPSASGKTTTAHLLMHELELLGEETNVVSLDDFYRQEDDLPLLPDGSRDLESVKALDTALISRFFDEIIKTGSAYLPKYDFKTHKRTDKAKKIVLGRHGIIIAEGLHALNPEISGLVPKENIYKIYISLNRSIEREEGEPLLTSRQIRFIRRVLRDEVFRGSDIKETLTLWTNVLAGEEKYLFPYKNDADRKIVTMQPFEVCVYKERFCRLRNAVDRNSPWYEFFINTVNALELFTPIKSARLPEDSLIREFIG